jgi:hypothetical protein
VLFDTAFFAGVDGVDADRQIGWFEHVGGGGNLRTAPGRPLGPGRNRDRHASG